MTNTLATYEHLRVEYQGAVAVITLDHPAALNATESNDSIGAVEHVHALIELRH